MGGYSKASGKGAKGPKGGKGKGKAGQSGCLPRRGLSRGEGEFDAKKCLLAMLAEKGPWLTVCVCVRVQVIFTSCYPWIGCVLCFDLP